MLSIEQIRAFYPGFPQDTQTTIHLLKEYIELLVLNHLSNTKYIEKLTFIGGTNLRLIKGIDRFSEDLDFDCKELSDMFRANFEETGMKTAESTKDGSSLNTDE